MAERSVCMRVCKHGSGVKMFCFSRANHASKNLKKIRVQNFNSENFSDKISQNTADIVFNDLTTEQLGKMASEIIFRQKAQINNIEVVRNDTKKLLEGKMSIVYLSQGDQ